MQNKLLKNRLRILKDFAIENNITIYDIFTKYIVDRKDILAYLKSPDLTFVAFNVFKEEYKQIIRTRIDIHDDTEYNPTKLNQLLLTYIHIDSITSIQELSYMLSLLSDYGVLNIETIHSGVPKTLDNSFNIPKLFYQLKQEQSFLYINTFSQLMIIRYADRTKLTKLKDIKTFVQDYIKAYNETYNEQKS